MLSLAVVSVQWYFVGYSLTFGQNSSGFIGTLHNVAFTGVGVKPHPLAPTIPEIVFAIYQNMFAVLTPALSFTVADRCRIFPFIVFLLVWSTTVYNVVASWAWNNNGWLYVWGYLDFAGGLYVFPSVLRPSSFYRVSPGTTKTLNTNCLQCRPVHMLAGFSALALSITVGKRNSITTMPHSMPNMALGASLLWVGWMGFNGGSAFAGNARAAMAMWNTNLAACSGAIAWMSFDFRVTKKYTSLGFCSGAICGLVAITPCAGFVAPWAAVIVGVLGALAANRSCYLKAKFGYDDSLDVFAVHGIAGAVGCILCAIFAQKWVMELDGGTYGPAGWLDGNFFRMLIHLCAVLTGGLWAFGVTFGIVKLMNLTPLHLRVTEEEENLGIDFALLGEQAWDFTNTASESPGAKRNDNKMTIENTSIYL